GARGARWQAGAEARRPYRAPNVVILSRNGAVIGQRTSPVVAAMPSSQMGAGPKAFGASLSWTPKGGPPFLRRGGGAASTSCDEGVAATTLHVFRYPTALLG